MNKQSTLEQIQSGRAKLLQAIDGLSEDAMRRVGAVGIWSVKDVLAHITAWESELVTALARTLTTPKIPHIVEIEDIDEWNMEQYSIHAPRPIDLILEDFHGVHKQLLIAVSDLDEKTLTDPRRFPWMEGEPLTYLIAEESYWHEEEHANEILEWRKTNNL